MLMSFTVIPDAFAPEISDFAGAMSDPGSRETGFGGCRSGSRIARKCGEIGDFDTFDFRDDGVSKMNTHRLSPARGNALRAFGKD